MERSLETAAFAGEILVEIVGNAAKHIHPSWLLAIPLVLTFLFRR